MKSIYPFINPIQWIKAKKFAKQNAQFDKSSFDLELALYSKILSKNMLHYGYFEDTDIEPKSISLEQFEKAQVKYAEKIIEHITDKEEAVLDVGCGIGGLAKLIHDKQFHVECLTPNQNQIEFIRANYQYLKSHQSKYEQFESENKYGTIINSESLQYISLEEAFKKTEELITSKGKWVIMDYFSLDKQKKPHYLDDFYSKIKAFGWIITFEQDITPNILPTLTCINLYVDRFLLPLKHYAYEKLRYKSPKLYYLSKKLRDKVDRKISKELKSVDSSEFEQNRKYLLIVLQKD